MSDEKSENTEESHSIGDIRDLVKEIVSEMIGGPSGNGSSETSVASSDKSSSTSSIQEEVRRELAKIKTADDEAAERQGFLDRLSVVEGRTAEKAPVERNRLHKMMGWGE